MSTKTTLTLPPTWGHAELPGQRANLGSRVSLHLFGKPERPQLRGYDPDSFGSYDIYPDRDELVRFAREVLAFLGEPNGVQLPPWRPAVNGAGARPWFVARGQGAEHDRLPILDRYHFRADGQLRRYATEAGAQRAADKLNAAQS